MSRLVFLNTDREVEKEELYGANFGFVLVPSWQPLVYRFSTHPSSLFNHEFRSDTRVIPTLWCKADSPVSLDAGMRNIVSEMRAQARDCSVGLLYRPCPVMGIRHFSVVALVSSATRLLALDEKFDVVEIFS